MALPDLRRWLGDATSFVESTLATVRSDRTRLPVVFPGLPRSVGRDVIGGGRTTIGDATIDLDAFRRCDLAAACVLMSLPATSADLLDLYAHGDIEERAMLLRSLHLLPPGAITVQLLGEVQRTNILLHLEAALCDGDLLVRTLGQPGFDQAVANRLLLKIAFLDLPLRRVFAAERLANVELSRMLQDLATEREAAGRSVWRDTARLLGRAPCPGATARLIGGLEHGDDGVRLAAAEGLLAMNRSDLAAFAAERLPREVRDGIVSILQRLAAPR